MFYSHEILTSRKYGVATVWLVATLGAKSNNTKRITRKAILDVSVKKACSTISEPDAPMALRLQSNLLYGVSRVYDQQCGYVLQDAQSAQNALRSLIKSSRSNQLDTDAGRARPEQLMLLDDPAFLPENALPALDFDFDLPNFGNFQRSSQSMLSIRDRSGSVNSSHTESVFGINLPSSSGKSGYQLPILDALDNTPIHKDYGGLGRDEEEQFIDNDNIFEFNEDGELLDLPAPPSSAILTGHRPSGSAASGRVRKEHEDGLGGPQIIGEDDFMMNYGDEYIGVLPDAEPFGPGDLPLMAGGLGGDDQPQHHLSQDRVHSAPEEEVKSISSVSAQAPQKRKSRKALAVDKQLNIRNDEFKLWHTEYVTRMAAASLVKEHQKANTQAKKNAFHFVFGSGINGVGDGIGSNKMASPLDIFSGDMLRALITAKPALTDDQKKGTKRAAEDDPSPPAKRSRDSELGRAGFPSNDNPMEDDGVLLNVDDDLSQSVELGRDARSAIADHPSSALMPWNKSASLHSHQRNLSSQQGRAGVFGSQVGSLLHRLASVSPLIGRGSNLAGDMEQLAMMQEEDAPMYRHEDDDLGSVDLEFGAGRGPSSNQGVSVGFNSQAARSHEEFEIFGRAANVDTQTAGTSQWVRDALDKESNNFFEYVRNTIEEKQSDELADKEEEPIKKSVTFEELFNVEGNSSIVAAQAFYHVLCLATKRRVWVQQEEIEDEEGAPIPFGEIKIGVFGIDV